MTKALQWDFWAIAPDRIGSHRTETASHRCPVGIPFRGCFYFSQKRIYRRSASVGK